MKQERKCLKCKKNFITYRDGKFCSLDCYRTKRWSSGTCKLCGKKTKFRWCSKECRNKYWCDRYYGNGNVLKSFWEKKMKVVRQLTKDIKELRSVLKSLQQEIKNLIILKETTGYAITLPKEEAPQVPHNEPRARVQG